jgi:hypothetical protein
MVTVKPCQRVGSLEWTDDKTQLSQTAKKDANQERAEESEQGAECRAWSREDVSGQVSSGRTGRVERVPCCCRCPFLFHMRELGRLHACQTQFIPFKQALSSASTPSLARVARPVPLILHSPIPSASLHQSCRFGSSSSIHPRRHRTPKCPTKSPQTPATKHLRISQAQSPALSCPPMNPYQTS